MYGDAPRTRSLRACSARRTLLILVVLQTLANVMPDLDSAPGNQPGWIRFVSTVITPRKADACIEPDYDYWVPAPIIAYNPWYGFHWNEIGIPQGNWLKAGMTHIIGYERYGDADTHVTFHNGVRLPDTYAFDELTASPAFPAFGSSIGTVERHAETERVWWTVPGTGTRNAQIFMTDCDKGLLAYDGPTETERKTVNTLGVSFTHPAFVPHWFFDPPLDPRVGYQLTPGLDSGELDHVLFHVTDPSGGWGKCKEWTPAVSTFEDHWDGIVGPWPFPISDFCQASDVFLSAEVGFGPDAHPWGGCNFLYFEPNAAIWLTGLYYGAIDAGAPFSLIPYTNGVWDFKPDEAQFDALAAFRVYPDPKPDTYHIYDLLYEDDLAWTKYCEYYPAGIYITGSKTEEAYDLGRRSVAASVTHEEVGTLSASYEFELVIMNARITHYYCPYEENDCWTGAMTAVSMSGGPPNTIYLCEDFLEEVKVQGTGKIFKIRTQSGMTKSQGTTPSASLQYIREVTQDTYSNWFGTFTNGIYGAYCGQGEQLHHQNAARYNTSTGHRSFYCHPGSYNVIGLAAHEAAVKSQMSAQDKPMAFSSDGITIKDIGPFDGETNIGTNEKQIDVFLEPDGASGKGIHRDNAHFRGLETHLKVVVP